MGLLNNLLLLRNLPKLSREILRERVAVPVVRGFGVNRLGVFPTNPLKEGGFVTLVIVLKVVEVDGDNCCCK